MSCKLMQFLSTKSCIFFLCRSNQRSSSWNVKIGNTGTADVRFPLMKQIPAASSQTVLYTISQSNAISNQRVWKQQLGSVLLLFRHSSELRLWMFMITCKVGCLCALTFVDLCTCRWIEASCCGYSDVHTFPRSSCGLWTCRTHQVAWPSARHQSSGSLAGHVS